MSRLRRGAGYLGVLLPLLLVLGWSTLARAELAVPPLQARVTDLTNTLSPQQRAALDRKLAAFEAAKGSQIAVLIVPSTAPETIEQYSIRVAEQWQLGRKGVDDGILVLVARNDHALRIEVGYGLEGVVPDAIAHRIIDEIMVPKFRAGDDFGAIDAGVTRLIGLVNGEPLPPPKRSQRSARGSDGWVVLLFVPIMIGSALRRVFGALPAGLLTGGGAALVAWLISGTLVMGLFAGVVIFVLVALGGFGGLGRFGGYGGGGLGGGGFGGGGFGGGGGGFGGGGASGRW